MKVVYIVSYSSHRYHSHDPLAHAQLQSIITPIGLPPLLTVNATRWTPPPRHLCHQYSGVSAQIQEAVLRVRKARENM